MVKKKKKTDGHINLPMPPLMLSLFSRKTCIFVNRKKMKAWGKEFFPLFCVFVYSENDSSNKVFVPKVIVNVTDPSWSASA